jgi:hypothetical protein
MDFHPILLCSRDNHSSNSGYFLSLTAMAVSSLILVAVTIVAMGSIMGGIGMIIPNILSLALERYRTTQGTAPSLFGFYYYCLISLFTLIMGLVHNGRLFPMPLFFLIIAITMYGATLYICKIGQRA